MKIVSFMIHLCRYIFVVISLHLFVPNCMCFCKLEILCSVWCNFSNLLKCICRCIYFTFCCVSYYLSLFSTLYILSSLFSRMLLYLSLYSINNFYLKEREREKKLHYFYRQTNRYNDKS